MALVLEDIPNVDRIDLNAVNALARGAAFGDAPDLADRIDRAGLRIIEISPLPDTPDWWADVCWGWPGLPRLAWRGTGGGAATVRRDMARRVPALAGPTLPYWAERFMRSRRAGNPTPWVSLRTIAAHDPDIPLHSATVEASGPRERRR